jgi:hypothetical protein
MDFTGRFYPAIVMTMKSTMISLTKKVLRAFHLLMVGDPACLVYKSSSLGWNRGGGIESQGTLDDAFLFASCLLTGKHLPVHTQGDCGPRSVSIMAS